MKTSVGPAEKALKNLEEALAIQNPSDLERDGTIQRFEYCYELIWKLAQRTLKDNDLEAETPKIVFRELGRVGWIDNVEAWIAFQKMRNETSHEDGKALAEKSYILSKSFLPLALKLFVVLKDKNRES